MSDPRPEVIDEPERIRALAHPLRLRLLDLLAEQGELTASQCAESTGESVASCSFHLRMLEKYGFIERAEPRGREKPWRRARKGGFQTDVDPDVIGSVAASAELALLAFRNRSLGVQSAFARLTDEDHEWVEATQLADMSFWATAEEAADLGARFGELLEPLRNREDPASRPPGSRRVHAMLTIHSDRPRDTRNPS